jgi:hypothetical protein
MANTPDPQPARAVRESRPIPDDCLLNGKHDGQVRDTPQPLDLEAVNLRWREADQFGGTTHSPIISDLVAEVERLRAVTRQAVGELDSEHAPMWSNDKALATGKEPIGCGMCFPHDGHWPCISRMIADDLRAAQP